MPANHHASRLRCTHCRARGVASWEPRQEDETAMTLTKVFGDFHIETGRTVPDSKIIVCNLCDQIYVILPPD